MNWIEFFKADKFACSVGIELTHVEPGYAQATMKIEASHLNAGGVAQGGSLFTLADLAMAAAINAHGVLAFSIQSDIRYLESAHEGDVLTATARQMLLKRTIAHCRVEVTNDKGTLIALMDGIFHRRQ